MSSVCGQLLVTGALSDAERERIKVAAFRETAVGGATRLYEEAYELKTGRHAFQTSPRAVHQRLRAAHLPRVQAS